MYIMKGIVELQIFIYENYLQNVLIVHDPVMFVIRSPGGAPVQLLLGASSVMNANLIRGITIRFEAVRYHSHLTSIGGCF